MNLQLLRLAAAFVSAAVVFGIFTSYRTGLNVTRLDTKPRKGSQQVPDLVHQEQKHKLSVEAGETISEDDDYKPFFRSYFKQPEIKGAAIKEGDVNVVLVLCGSLRQMDMSAVLVKSIVLLTKVIVHFHIVTDDQKFYTSLVNETSTWPAYYRDKIIISSYDVYYPEDQRSLKGMYASCASELLFLAKIFTELDKVIYLDTDEIVLQPIEDLWAEFDKFNSSQLVSIAANGNRNYEIRRGINAFPVWGKSGLNTGTVLLHLERIRDLKEDLTETLIDILEEDKKRVPLVDQDVMNIYANLYPHTFYELGCQWNYRIHRNKTEYLCDNAMAEGAAIMHGNTGMLVGKHEMKWAKMFQGYQQHNLSKDSPQQLFEVLKENLKEVDRNQTMRTHFRKDPWINGVLLGQLSNHIQGASLDNILPETTTTTVPTTTTTTTTTTEISTNETA